MRWGEEVQLVTEEMRRVLCYFAWKQKWWEEQWGKRSEVRPDIKEGVEAYAAKQASILGNLGRRFVGEWYPIMATYDLEMKWPEAYVRGGEKKKSQTVVAEEIWDQDMGEDMEDVFD